MKSAMELVGQWRYVGTGTPAMPQGAVTGGGGAKLHEHLLSKIRLKDGRNYWAYNRVRVNDGRRTKNYKGYYNKGRLSNGRRTKKS